jgi:hypothetical protein
VIDQSAPSPDDDVPWPSYFIIRNVQLNSIFRYSSLFVILYWN